MAQKKKLLVVGLLALTSIGLVGCNNGSSAKTYTYNTYLDANPKTWNVHNWETADDSYIIGFTEMGLYDMGFNADKTGYEFLTEMASDFPKDSTADLTPTEKETYFGSKSVNISNQVAYDIPLNKAATWEDGTAINADTYVESMRRLLNPKMSNHRADSFYKGNLILANAEDYFKQGTSTIEPAYNYIKDSSTLDSTDTNFGQSGIWYVNLGAYTPYPQNYFSKLDDSDSTLLTILTKRSTKNSDAVENAAARIQDAVGKMLIHTYGPEGENNSDWKEVEKVSDIKDTMWDHDVSQNAFDDYALTVVGGATASMADVTNYKWADLQKDLNTFVKGLGQPSSLVGRTNAWRLACFSDYYNDKAVDFSKVGIEKIDDYTIRLITS